MERMPQNEWIELLLGSGDSVPTRSLHGDDAQVFFEAGDQVRFRSNDGGTRTGTVEKLNPKRARVRCGAQNWVVPYAGLEHLCATTAADRRSRVTRLKDVAAEVRDLMDRHGLDEWTLRFSAATKKLGECRSQHKLILISRSHAVHGTPEQVTDTICHEIAHALAGPEAGHGPAWKALARQLGATPKSCAPENDETRRRREAVREQFCTGDSVSFIARGELQTGVILRMNPKRAKVKSGDSRWSVPYARLSATLRRDASPLKVDGEAHRPSLGS